MKKTNPTYTKSIKIICLIISFYLLPENLTAQNEKTQRALEKVKSETNSQFLLKQAEELKKVENRKKQEALEKAKEMAWPIKKTLADGSIIEIMYLDDFGMPVYYSTNNLNAAKTTSTTALWPAGNLNLDLTGNGMLVGVWDGGATRLTHQEFGNRVNQVDGAVTLDNHATHVGGTIGAAGVIASAKGMAYEVNIDAYDWNNDGSEMSTAAANGLLISNHSYGTIGGWRFGFDEEENYWFGVPAIHPTLDYKFGQYSNTARSWDLIANNAPYYLIVKSAGNDRSDNYVGSPGHYVRETLSSNWTWSTDFREPDGNYDCISTSGNAKNILTVGAVNDIVNGYSISSDVVMSTFSSWGPTDDGRIKPDICGNGVGVYSTLSTSNSSYGSMSGTSMSAPNVTGSLILLQEHYLNLNSSFMKASTLKALAIHTADEAGPAEGPDYMFGWGLLNTKKAAELISNDTSDKKILERILYNNETDTFKVFSYGNEPLIVTIVWNDPAATAQGNTINNSTVRLVNDLDLRIYDSTANVYYPYILDPANPNSAASKNDNFRDNVEKIYISNPNAGEYEIVVSHKNSLAAASQEFSIIISGATLDLSQITCLNPSNINVDITSSTSANITWTENGFANNWEIEHGLFGFTPTGTPNILNINANNYNLSGLSHSTSYDIYLRADCGAGSYSDWIGPISFNTSCINSTQFPVLTIDAADDDVTLEISPCSYENQYSRIGNIKENEIYLISTSNNSYVTIRQNSFDGNKIAEGYAPLNFSVLNNDDIFIHWNKDSSCETDSVCISTTIKCLSCVDFLYTEDFSSGIGNFTSSGANASLWYLAEFVGNVPGTNRNYTQSPSGKNPLFYGQNGLINAPTTNNGFLMIDLDAYNNDGGNPTSNTISAYITSPIIDLSGAVGAVEFSFYHSLRYCCNSNSGFLLQVSTDNFNTFQSFNVVGDLAINDEKNDNFFSVNISNAIQGDPTNFQYRFFAAQLASHYFWMIDDIEIKDIRTADPALIFAHYTQNSEGNTSNSLLNFPYFIYDFSQIRPLNSIARVFNNGGVTLNNVFVQLTLNGPNGFTEIINSDSIQLNFGDTFDLNLPAFTPPQIAGDYLLTYSVFSDEFDENQDNNTIIRNIRVSEDVFAADRDTIVGEHNNTTLGGNTSGNYYIGNFYEISNQTSVKGVSCHFSANSTVGKTVRAIIIQQNTNTEIASKSYILAANDINNWTYIEFDNLVNLNENTVYLVAIEYLENGTGEKVYLSRTDGAIRLQVRIRAYDTGLNYFSSYVPLIRLNMENECFVNDTLTIASCDNFTWDKTNLSYENSGFYSDTITNPNGCDSIFVLDLTIFPTSLDTIVESACDSFTWNVNNETYSSSGFYVDTLNSVNNCDSVVVLDLTIFPTSLDTIVESACNSFTWNVNNETYSSSGFYADTLSSVNNCDSVVVLDLTIFPTSLDTIVESACNSFTWNVNSETYFSSGFYADTLSSVNNCDSVVVLDLTIFPTSLDTIVESACNSFTWNVNNETYSSSGFYVDTLSSVNNCDSVVVLDLTIFPTSLDTIVESACNSFTWNVNNETYFSSGFYADTLNSVNNCDSVVVLDLTILPEFLSLYSEVDCNEFTWDANGQTYFSSGTYFDTLQTIDGCDSILQLDLIIYENNNNCDVYIWNGNEDIDWENPNNWNTVSVPNDNEKVIIPPGRSHYPILDEDVVIDTLFLDGIINTNGKTLYIGASENQVGHIIWENGYIDGTLSRWIPTNNYDAFSFPIGKNNHLTNVNIQFTDSPNNAGTVVINYKENNTDTLPIGLYDNAVLITNIHPKGYWEINPQNGLSGGTYSVSISNNDMGGLVDVAELRIVKRDNSSQAWQIEGNHVAGTMENGVPTAHRSNLVAFSEFAIASSEVNPLPIKLLSFNIACEKTNYYTAKWKTLSEVNNDIFEIQASYDMESWFTVAKTQGANNSNTLLSYEAGFQLEEKTIIKKSVYFRLKQTDFDGKNSVSTIAYSDCENKNSNLKVYPTPTKNFINIDLDQNIGKVNISITDLYGKMVFNQDFENMTNEKINLENLANGIYTLRITDAEFNNYNFKIIKN
jgi:hypothetical protein